MILQFPKYSKDDSANSNHIYFNVSSLRKLTLAIITEHPNRELASMLELAKKLDHMQTRSYFYFRTIL